MVRPLHILLLCTACGSSHTSNDAGAGDAVSDSPPDVEVDGSDDSDATPIDARPSDASLPPRPDDWDAPFPLEPGGWRDSEEPHCSTYVGNLQGHDVWSDSRGVFVLVSVVNNPFDPGDPATPDGYSVVFNSGDRWETWHEQEGLPGSSPPTGMTGIVDGDIFTFGGACQIEQISAEGATCSYLGDITDGSVLDLSMVDSEFGWALTQRVLRFDGTAWESHTPAPSGAQHIWGDRGQFSTVGFDSLHTFDFDSGLTERNDIPSGTYGVLWATARDDLWVAADARRLLQFDGATWTDHELSLEGFVVDMWGSESELYFAGPRALGRVVGDDVEVLVSWDEPLVFIRSIWGAPEGGLFVAIADERYQAHECGASFLVWFDGSVFRQF